MERLEGREGAPVTPTMSFSEAIHAPMERRILWPGWRWSKVPPRAMTGRSGGEEGSGMVEGDMGEEGASREWWSAGVRKHWRTEARAAGSGTPIVSVEG